MVLLKQCHEGFQQCSVVIIAECDVDSWLWGEVMLLDFLCFLPLAREFDQWTPEQQNLACACELSRGDPLSPLLFFIIMDVMNAMV